MLLSPSFLVAMETKIVFQNVYNCGDINILKDTIREYCSKSNLLQLSVYSIRMLPVARGTPHLATAK